MTAATDDASASTGLGLEDDTGGGGGAVERTTAIRVVVRCRPVLSGEAELGKRMTSLTLSEGDGTVSLLPKSDKDCGGGDRYAAAGAVRDFGFDAVLGPD
eukprot:CAMPEP_0198701426 /NCGR_PEP_ID=MMETSP1468-20131203/385054_1 /TAXON_ID=1461545 /ORGANISM="Mantoniella sp, Strain CCMP1436" /LENGTH=99 /DNA_ID=CAMNT_0044459759 /DNA_START=1 /DNA_END=297 /DNA_ORIENTATION=-